MFFDGCPMLKRFFLALICLLPMLPVDAQNHQPEFTVSVLEDSVYQGDSIHVVYSIDARGYSFSTDDARMEGGEQIRFSYDMKDIGNAWTRLTFNATFLVKGCGELSVLPMKVTMNGNPVYSDTVKVNVLPDPEYGHEWTIANDFLKRQGVITRNLTYKYGTETMMAFSDAVAKAFVIVAASPYDQFMVNPVLAYGTGDTMWNGMDTRKDNSVYYILERYDQQLKELRRMNLVYSGLGTDVSRPDSKGVSPLLDDYKYDQNPPYNNMCPVEDWGGRQVNCVAGCGPIALAEVLSYHHSDVAPQGYAPFSIYSGKEYVIDLDEYRFSWSGSSKDLSALVMSCAASVSVRMSPWSSYSSLSNFKSALVSVWGYDPQCLRTEKGDCFRMLDLVRDELDSSRPVIVADNEHIFACDGYYDDFLHFNLGWNGYCNGYYRVIVLPSFSGWQLPFSEVLTGVRPSKGDLSVNIKVDSPGNLRNLLGEKDLMNVTSLTVSGTIDGDDINLIRCMAGAADSSFHDGQCGSLMHLDMSDVSVIGGTCYACVDADGDTIEGYLSGNSRKPDIELVLSAGMSDEEWGRIVGYGFNQDKDSRYERDSEGHFHIRYYTTENVIGRHMFDGCENLVSVKLPKKLKGIDGTAFRGCRSLKKVGNLPRRYPLILFKDCRFMDIKVVN